ncbi:hypothetical protein RhiirA1_451015 [Rhizophagus irregularis]|uniref:Uncharacterized protein n=1 Tax=Rhizophagus irregularis TaxID=588596 RepID=A0A2N0SDG9_9GLOM|nr:hypothetical protein RhiirA1_451015 [Rhizophagus irregularis]GET63617.1 hypothetical protein RIR_e791_A0A2N0SDG9_9GLOM [Rhizophagus irregularis DAOM 181602=DAOM 197198]CAG8714997.1 20885_t:CDS:2 [Rhizophagus irregularis]
MNPIVEGVKDSESFVKASARALRMLSDVREHKGVESTFAAEEIIAAALVRISTEA